MITEGATVVRPLLQVQEIKQVSTPQSQTERYRMVLSDGDHYSQAMLATQMNEAVREGKLTKGSVVQLNEFICNTIQGRRIIIVINLEVVVEKCELIGEPKNCDNSALQNRTAMPVPSSGAEQQNVASGNTQSYGSSHSSGSVSGQSMISGISVNPKSETVTNHQSYGGAVPGRNIGGVNSLHTKTELGAGNSVDSYGNGGIQNQRFPNTSVGGFRPHGNTYGRLGQQAYQQPSPMYTNRGPIAKNEAPARIVPIASLNPYQGRWTIKARVTSKGELRRYNNPRGEGKVWSFDLLDSEGGEIRITCFNLVADQFYNQIEAGKVYLISKGTLKPAQKAFNHLNNDYEIFLESTSTIQPCLDEDDSIPKQQFNFRPISEIESMVNNSMVDVIGIVSSINPAGTVMRKNGIETHKRTLQLKDMSGRSVEITLWGNFCSAEGQQLQDMCDSGMSPVLAVKAGRVSDFSGKSVGTISTSQLFINPDFAETRRLTEWFSREGKSIAAPSISRDSPMGRTDVRKTVSQIKDEGLGRSEKPDWITVKATVSFIKTDSFCYTACPLMVGDRQCNKKVINNGDGTWQCERCDKSFPECDYRYLLQFQIQDHTGMTWVTAFQESGEEIMGVSAKKMYYLKFEEQDDIKFAEIIRNILFNQYLFKLKVKEETFSDEQRVKSTVVKAEKVSPSSESRYLLGLIEKLSVESSNGVSAMGGTVIPGFGMPNSAGYGSMGYKPALQSYSNNSMSSGVADSYKVEPANQAGLRPSGYGVMNHPVGMRESQPSCNSCGSIGHTFQNCPRGMNRQGQSFAGDIGNRSSNVAMDSSNVCFKCNQPGHWARDCPGSNGVRSYR